MDCYVVCNMFPPLVSDVVRAPGLRAEQLAHQAKAQFGRVIYLMLKSRYNMLLRAAPAIQRVRAHPDFLVIHDTYMNEFLDRIDRSAFVFTQPQMRPLFERVIGRHAVIYDILAPKALELRCGGAAQNEIKAAENTHRFFADHADRILVNGSKNMDLFGADLERAGAKGHNNPFCPMVGELPEEERLGVMFFSSAQKWTNNASFLNNIATCLADRPEVNAYFMSALKPHEDPESTAISRLLQLPNVRRVSGLSYPAHLGLLARCACVMDWSRVNEERRNSTSTRLLQAVASGAAILGNAGTGLDAFWPDYPGENHEDVPGSRDISDFIDAALSGHHRDQIAAAQASNRQVLSDASLFEDVA